VSLSTGFARPRRPRASFTAWLQAGGPVGDAEEGRSGEMERTLPAAAGKLE